MQPKGSKSSNYLIVFDVEGVVVPKRRYLLMQASKKLAFNKILIMLTLGLLYEVGLLSLEVTLKRIYHLFKGINFKEFSQTFEEIPLIPGTYEVFHKLKSAGYTIALLSSGLPTFFVRALANKLGADIAFGLELEIFNDRLTGRAYGDVIEDKGKAIILSKILREKNIPSKNCVIIADDRNNLPLFNFSQIRIGYNPDFLLAIRADHVVRGNISEVLPILFSEEIKRGKKTVPRSTIIRKTIHIGSFLIPLICQHFNLDRFNIAYVIVIVSLMFTFSELARLTNVHIPFFSKITKMAAVGDEQWNFASSPLFFAMGVIISLTFFPKTEGIVAITILTLGDGTATLFGELFGRTVLPYNKSKSLEGTLFGMLFSFIGLTLFVTPFIGLVTCVFGMLVESLSTPINDNLTTPLITGLLFFLLS